MRRNLGVGGCSIVLTHFPAVSSDAEVAGEKVVHFDFGEANDFGREFDERQAALPHQVVYRSLADVQAPSNLCFGFVIRRRGKLFSFRVHARSFIFRSTLPRNCQTTVYHKHEMLSHNRMTPNVHARKPKGQIPAVAGGSIWSAEG